MQRFRGNSGAPIIEAVQITTSTFSDPHPNPTHVIGVLYDPRSRTATFSTNAGGNRTPDLWLGHVGDWIEVLNNEPISIIANADLRAKYTSLNAEI